MQSINLLDIFDKVMLDPKSFSWRLREFIFTNPNLRQNLNN